MIISCIEIDPFLYRKKPQSRWRARDSTVYGGSSTSVKSFFVHHTQQLAAAAQVGDAKGIRKKITEMKMRLSKGRF